MVLKNSRNLLPLFTWLLILLITGNATAQTYPRTGFSRQELVGESFSWLAKPNNRDKIHVYKLSCPSCIQEMVAAFKKDPKNIGLVNLSTFKKSDRPLAQALIATTLSHSSEKKRAEVFGELLNIFVNSANQFHKNGKEWQSLCLNYWNYDAFKIDDPRPWADALNWMDRQNRINVLMDATTFPASIEVKDSTPIPPIQQETYRDGYLFVALSLPWLKYPATHPNPGQPESENHPEELPVEIINPLKQFSVLDWRTKARTARAGAFWHFVGEPDITLHPRMLEFLAPLFELPTDEARRLAFAKAIETIAGDQYSPSRSILAAIPKAELPKVSGERREQCMEEVRKMVGDFLAYDHLRK